MKMKASNNPAPEQQRIRDLGLVATLVCFDFAIKSTERDGQRVYFIFDDSHKLQACIDCYWADLIKIEPRKYCDTLRMLKSRIYNGVGS